MKINKPIAQSKVPQAMNKLGRRQTNPEYDDLVSKAKDLPKNKSLPIQCENKAEYLRLYQSLRNRHKKDKGFTVQARMGELTIYLSGSGDEEVGIVKSKQGYRTRTTTKAKAGTGKKRTASKKKATTK